MLQRDYIMRLMQLFMEALARFLRNKGGKTPQMLSDELDVLYKDFVKYPRHHFEDLSVEEIMNTFIEEERMQKVEIVAELLFQEALLKETPDKALLKKAMTLLKAVDLVSDTFSLERQRKIGEIESLLNG